MLNIRQSLKSSIATILIATVGLVAIAPAAVAQDRDRRGHHDGRGGHRPDWQGDRRWNGPSRGVVIAPRPHDYRAYRVPRLRHYEHVRVYRPYGRVYPGFGFYYQDHDALRFLGLTALSLIVFNQLNESQQRAHEAAMVEASAARIGEPIIWNNGRSAGSITAVRDGFTPDGRQCREFRQEVTIGGRRTEAYGTACMQPDGSWEVVNN